MYFANVVCSSLWAACVFRQVFPGGDRSRPYREIPAAHVAPAALGPAAGPRYESPLEGHLWAATGSARALSHSPALSPTLRFPLGSALHYCFLYSYFCHCCVIGLLTIVVSLVLPLLCHWSHHCCVIGHTIVVSLVTPLLCHFSLCVIVCLR